MPTSRPPSIDHLLKTETVQQWLEQFPRPQIVESLRNTVAAMRLQKEPDWKEQTLLDEASARLQSLFQPSLRPVLNCTGTLLHTNLGRSPLSPRSLKQIWDVCSGYCNLELDLASGKRGRRHDHIKGLLQQISGAPASLVVNNCAAAMLLIVDEFARGKEVVVSRGELVEIGGSFRIPEVLQRGGAQLVEVGTTNRTYLRDFERAISPETGMILSTHLSNFALQGFVHQASAQEIVALARQHQVVSVFDLGSGLLESSALPQGWPEPSIRQAIADDWDLVAFSGDKLLGSAQAGIILGKAELIERLERNPWMRALRLDKLRLAALQGSLLDHMLCPSQIPLWSMLHDSLEELKKRALRVARKARKYLGPSVQVEVRPSFCSVGGGTTPGQLMDSWAVCLKPTDPSLEEMSRRLRLGKPSVLARLHQDWLWLDLRTVPGWALVDLESALKGLAS